VVLATNAQIADYGLEQYRGSDGKGNGPDAHFTYNNVPLGLFEYARAAMSGGKFAFNPSFELQVSLQSLCHDVRERAIHVNMAMDAAIHRKAEPSVPTGKAGADTTEWDAYATLPMDARLRNSFATLYRDLSQMITLWNAHDPRIVSDRGSLIEHLKEIYAQQSQACVITYTNSDAKAVSLNLDQVSDRLFALDFDPYHCPERRWGATGAELASCKDDETKSGWYRAEQGLRNQMDVGFVARPSLSLTDRAQAGNARAWNVRLLIDGTQTAQPAL
jgi:hypothetical protein